jgi:hypothetical protein
MLIDLSELLEQHADNASAPLALLLQVSAGDDVAAAVAALPIADVHRLADRLAVAFCKGNVRRWARGSRARRCAFRCVTIADDCFARARWLRWLCVCCVVGVCVFFGGLVVVDASTTFACASLSRCRTPKRI